MDESPEMDLEQSAQLKDMIALNEAQDMFRVLLSQLQPSVGSYLLSWICEKHESIKCDMYGPQPNNHPRHANIMQMSSIIHDLRGRLPDHSGVCNSENILPYNTDELGDTVTIDSFLYDDDDVDVLVEKEDLSRNYCRTCGSHNTSPLTYMSHSMSVNEMDFIFTKVLPTLITNFSNTTLVDVGSRLGAVLYGAYYYSSIEKIIGVEINNELCSIQQDIVEKYDLGNTIQIINSDICECGQLLEQADVVVLHNSFQYFLSKEQQIRTWKYIRKHVSKSGCIVISVPTVEESVCLDNDETMTIFNVHEWLSPLTKMLDKVVDCNSCTDDVEEFYKFNFYKVK